MQIMKVCKTYDIPKEPKYDKLREQFKSKLWRMGKRLASRGGPGRERQLKLWKEGAQSTWALSVEIGSLYRQLQRQFKKLEVQNQWLTSDLKLLKEKRKEKTQQLQSQLRTIQTVVHRALTGDLHVPHTKKALVEYTAKYQKSKQKILAKEMKSALKMCDRECIMESAKEREEWEAPTR